MADSLLASNRHLRMCVLIGFVFLRLAVVMVGFVVDFLSSQADDCDLGVALFGLLLLVSLLALHPLPLGLRLRAQWGCSVGGTRLVFNVNDRQLVLELVGAWT